MQSDVMYKKNSIFSIYADVIYIEKNENDLYR